LKEKKHSFETKIWKIRLMKMKDQQSQ